MIRATLLLTAAVLTAGVCGGCRSAGFSRPNFDTLHVGQDAKEVPGVLGKPCCRLGDKWVYLHEEPFFRANIYVAGSPLKIVRKEWIDEMQADGHTLGGPAAAAATKSECFGQQKKP